MLKRFLTTGYLYTMVGALCAAQGAPVEGQESTKINIIPQPVQIELLTPVGNTPSGFKFSENTRISTDVPEFMSATKNLSTILRKGTQVDESKAKGQKSNIVVVKGDANLERQGKEAYSIEVTPDIITIAVNSPKGVFYAVQSLIQLLPVEFFASEKGEKAEVKWEVPLLKMVDYPRFGWRSLMLDSARHFWTVDQVKQIIDQMALLKLNVLQWHLTDDAGWRVEIKKYPKLISVGSTRKDTEVGTWGSGKRVGQPHSGFYTQAQIKDVVRYAAQRNITVVPEVGMIGHVSALVAAYPEMSADKKVIDVPEHFGKLPAVLDPTQEATFTFLSNVIDELLQMFPSKIIHIGGDEVKFDDWDNSPAVQKFAKDQGFKNTNTDVQVYFANRLSRLIESKGGRMMGWNEILGHDLHGQGRAASTATLSPSAIVHFWKGDTRLATDAINKGNDVVNSAHYMTYLDYSYGNISLEKAYSFNPMFDNLDPKHSKKVLGFGCQMWTEWISEPEKLHYQIFPRLLAYAEVGWTQLDHKNFPNFKQRLKSHSKRMDMQRIHYAKDAVAAISHADFFNSFKVGDWTPESINNNPSSWNITEAIKAPGELKVTLLYSKGSNALKIKSVVLKENGKVIASDIHDGGSGKELKNITYTLKLPAVTPNAQYTLETDIEGDGGGDSYGSIYLEK